MSARVLTHLPAHCASHIARRYDAKCSGNFSWYCLGAAIESALSELTWGSHQHVLPGRAQAADSGRAWEAWSHGPICMPTHP